MPYKKSIDHCSLFRSYDPHIAILFILVGQDEMHRDNYGVDCLHFSSLEGHAEVIRLLLEYGADVDSQDDQGRTSLLMACQQGKADCVNVLLDCGADVNLPAHNGRLSIIPQDHP